MDGFDQQWEFGGNDRLNERRGLMGKIGLEECREFVGKDRLNERWESSRKDG